MVGRIARTQLLSASGSSTIKLLYYSQEAFPVGNWCLFFSIYSREMQPIVRSITKPAAPDESEESLYDYGNLLLLFFLSYMYMYNCLWLLLGSGLISGDFRRNLVPVCHLLDIIWPLLQSLHVLVVLPACLLDAYIYRSTYMYPHSRLHH